MRRSLLIVLLMWPILTANGQSTCGNSDFETGSFFGWRGAHGSCCPININNMGLILGRHTIMTGAGVDPYSLGKIPVVAPGGSYSARIGNDDAGAEADQLSYEFIVTPANALFMYQYALVLEDPQHSAQHQPRFEVEMYDQFDNIIPCASYSVTAASNLPGFFDNGKVRLKEWSSVGIDLTNYIGQNVRIDFAVSDCGLGAHFGYAYIDCSCGGMNITSDFCENASSVQLTAPPGFSYSWSNGATTQSINVLNPSQGMSYSVTLTSVTGCQVTLNHFLEPIQIKASFSASGCSNDVQFSDASNTGTGSIQSWTWDFGDGTTSNLQNPSHNYANAGSYFVKLKVENTFGCLDSLITKVQVYEGPVAEFQDYTSCYYKPVAFKDISTTDQGVINKWKWYFGDSISTSHQQFPAHKYDASGNYRVSLVVNSSLGCTDSVSRMINVFKAPKSLFSVNNVCEGIPVLFNSSSTTFNGMPLFHNWNFGDNNGFSLLEDPTYDYIDPGIYQVELIVATDHWCADTLIKELVVAPIPEPDFNVNAPCEGQEATFVDKTSLQFGSVKNWAWDFGDGGAGSNLSSPRHIYHSSGSYPVKLRVTSDYGCRSMTEKIITVFDSPVSDFRIRPLQGCSPLEVRFSDRSSTADGIINKWNWQMGGSTISNIQNFSQTFYQSGKYDIALEVSTDKGCSDTKTVREILEINPTVIAEFEVETSHLTNLAPYFQFRNLSQNADSYTWLVNDSIVSHETDLKWYAYEAGSYTITLIGNNQWNCSDTVSTKLSIEEDFAFYIPNTFTPNGDGKNDLFYGSGVGVTDAKMQIFNRWGAEVYDCNGKSCSWNGEIENKSAIAQDGVYLYVIRVRDIFNEFHTFRGHVTLMH